MDVEADRRVVLPRRGRSGAQGRARRRRGRGRALPGPAAAAYAAQPIETTPLALSMLAASEAPLPERRRQLREIGDTSLFVSGFWSDSFARARGRRRLLHRHGRLGLRRARPRRDGLDPRSLRRRVRGAGRELRPLRRRAGADQPARARRPRPIRTSSGCTLLAAERRAPSAAARLAAMGVVAAARRRRKAAVRRRRRRRTPRPSVLARLQRGLEALYRVETHARRSTRS